MTRNPVAHGEEDIVDALAAAVHGEIDPLTFGEHVRTWQHDHQRRVGHA